LNKGELVAQGPIEELLAGSEGVIYIVHLKGEVDAAQKLVEALPWVSALKTSQHNEESIWQVSISDPETAERELLKLLVNQPVIVNEFRRKQYELEDVFMQVVEGGQNVGK
jgi:ABC-type multidrug transport system ATPase subunit